MGISGVDYTYLANVEPAWVELSFLKKVKEIWPKPIMELCEQKEEGVEIFFAKDALMDFLHADNGYTLNEEGEGCFMFYTRKFSLLQCDAQLSHAYSPGEIKCMDSYRSSLFLANVWEFTLVLPARIEEADFSRKIHQSLVDVLSERSSHLARQ